MHTPCKECIFAEYEDITQVGCSRNMLDKYKNVGVDIIEAYDEDKEFYVIKDRACPFFRKQAWKEIVGDRSIEDLLKLETILSFHLIIFLRNGSLADIKKTVDSVTQDFIRPVQITVIRPNTSTIQPKDITESLKDVPTKWRVENLVIDMDDTKAIHMVQKTIKSQYYIIADAGLVFPKSYLKTINHAVIDDLIQFGMMELEKDNDNGVIIPLKVHEFFYFKGDINKTIPECIREQQELKPAEKIVWQKDNLSHQFS